MKKMLLKRKLIELQKPKKKKKKKTKYTHTHTHDKEETENSFERKLFHNCCYLKIAKRRICKIQGIASL
jgi:hypothetical protein